jgi:hypothetical protein
MPQWAQSFVVFGGLNGRLGGIGFPPLCLALALGDRGLKQIELLRGFAVHFGSMRAQPFCEAAPRYVFC